MRSFPRWIAILLLVGLVVGAACTSSSLPWAATEDPVPNVSNAAGEGYIGPAETHGNPGSTGSFPFGGGATGGSQTGTAAGGSTQASPAPSPATP